MGSGKSTAGKPLAKDLNYSFVDTDLIIEDVVGTSIQSFFKDNSEEDFRDIETKVLQSVGQHHSLVIATGGGVIMRSENWGVLHQGIVIWLDLCPERLIKRLRSETSKRPLINDSDPATVIPQLLEKRKHLYAESDLHLTIEEESPKEVAELILKRMPSILKDPNDPTSPQTIGA